MVVEEWPIMGFACALFFVAMVPNQRHMQKASLDEVDNSDNGKW